jgi:hypothetical protein
MLSCAGGSFGSGVSASANAGMASSVRVLTGSGAHHTFSAFLDAVVCRPFLLVRRERVGEG